MHSKAGTFLPSPGCRCPEALELQRYLAPGKLGAFSYSFGQNKPNLDSNTPGSNLTRGKPKPPVCFTIQPQASPADPFLPPPLLLVPPADTARRGPSRQAVREKKKEQNLSQRAIACRVPSEEKVGTPEVNFRSGKTGREGRKQRHACATENPPRRLSRELLLSASLAHPLTHPHLAEAGK